MWYHINIFTLYCLITYLIFFSFSISLVSAGMYEKHNLFWLIELLQAIIHMCAWIRMKLCEKCFRLCFILWKIPWYWNSRYYNYLNCFLALLDLNNTQLKMKKCLQGEDKNIPFIIITYVEGAFLFAAAEN